ncbi:thioesterase II family protein [Kitasatospora sp. NPDC057500]|uniref:thioesterase II family protein n=1 Tax=Kitasatospora sp. NPDC057500 TaxID=3346151 RepID=UPI0036B73951
MIAFPHAGGSASYFFPLAEALRRAAVPLELDILAVQYPGRQERRLEPCIGDLRTLAELAAEELLPFTDRPLVFFGHSMGAMVAFEVAQRFEQQHGTTPLMFFASGRGAPATARRDALHRLPDQAIIDELGLLDGTNSALLSDPEVLKMVMPAIRADYQAVETYTYRPAPPLRCPVHVVVGDSDPRVSEESAQAWAQHTEGGHRLSVFDGGHFYLKDQQDALVDTIVDRLNTLSVQRSAHG